MDFINTMLVSVISGACCGILGYVNSMLEPRRLSLSVMNWGLLIAILGASVFAVLEWGVEAGILVFVLGILSAGSAYRQRWVR